MLSKHNLVGAISDSKHSSAQGDLFEGGLKQKKVLCCLAWGLYCWVIKLCASETSREIAKHPHIKLFGSHSFLLLLFLFPLSCTCMCPHTCLHGCEHLCVWVHMCAYDHVWRDWKLLSRTILSGFPPYSLSQGLSSPKFTHETSLACPWG